jgi:glycosyltransferase involved in cell wall biosynthesis
MVIRVRLVSPLPPPAGGIARWTKLVTDHAQSLTTVRLSVMNTALRWRTVTQSSTLTRIAAGVPQIVHCVAILACTLLLRRTDVVHINTSGQFGLIRDFILASLARAFGVPVVVHIRFGRVPAVLESAGYERRLLLTLMAKADAAIAIDNKTHAALGRSLPNLVVELIPNCIERTGSVPGIESSSGRYVLFAGWVVPAKGVEELVEAWRQLPNQGWTLVIAGAYDPSYLATLGLRPGMNGTISIVGELEHGRMLDLMASCDIFALPSHTEGFPNAVLEAMSLGRAIVSCDVGAVSDMLSGDCGIVVPVRDVRRLRQAIEGLISSPARRQMLGSNAADRARASYEVSTVFKRYVDVWSSLGG